MNANSQNILANMPRNLYRKFANFACRKINLIYSIFIQNGVKTGPRSVGALYVWSNGQFSIKRLLCWTWDATGSRHPQNQYCNQYGSRLSIKCRKRGDYKWRPPLYLLKCFYSFKVFIRQK